MKIKCALLGIFLIGNAFLAAESRADLPKKIKHSTCILNLNFESEPDKPLGGFESNIIGYLIDEKGWFPMDFDISVLKPENLQENDYYLTITYKKLEEWYHSVNRTNEVFGDISGAKIVKIENKLRALPVFQKRYKYEFLNKKAYDSSSAEPGKLSEVVIGYLKSFPRCVIK